MTLFSKETSTLTRFLSHFLTADYRVGHLVVDNQFCVLTFVSGRMFLRLFVLLLLVLSVAGFDKNSVKKGKRDSTEKVNLSFIVKVVISFESYYHLSLCYH